MILKPLKIHSYEQSSIMVKFQVLFFLIALIPISLLLFLFSQVSDTGQLEFSKEDLNTALIFVSIGVAAGYVSMRMMLKNLVDVTTTTAEKLREVMGPEKVQDLLKGDENEIAVLARTFKEITTRLEDNVNNLELTKKTLQSVLTRVGQGMSNLRNIDTFFDLIVETVTEALAGKKGFILLLDPVKNELYVKTVYGMSSKIFDPRTFSFNSSAFSSVLITRQALIIPKLQYLKTEGQSEDNVFDYPIVCAPLLLHDQVLGIIAVSGRKLGAGFQDEEVGLLMNLATQTAVAIENSRLNQDAGKTYFETLAALAMAVEAKDIYSRGHLDRVGHISVQIAQRLGMTPQEVGHVRDAARIHDLGKIGVTDEILVKAEPLSAQEWIIMKRHPEIGEGIIKPISSLQPLCDIVRHHHEKLDGSGYPDGLKGDEIKLPVRIMSIADIYDALTTDRPYRKAMPYGEAIRTMREMGGEIDQGIVDALTEIVHEA
jgi:HD-GYP domain-containing protein (c-di-GMP phosphodiesterase class II)